MKQKLARIYIFIFMLFTFFSSLSCMYKLLDGHEALQTIYFLLHIGSFYMMMFWRPNNKE